MASVKFYLEKQKNRGSILSIRVHEVLPTDFEIGASSGFYTFQDQEFSLKIRLLSEALRFAQDRSPFKDKHRILKQQAITLRHKKKGTFDIILDIDGERIKRHDFKKGRLKITFQNGWYEVEAYLELQPATLADLMIKESGQNRRGSGITMMKVTEEKKLDPFDKDDRKSRDKLNKSKTVKEQVNLGNLGIYLTHPNAFRRCENCVNYTVRGCSTHKVEVSSSHACKKFYSYRTYLGGGFSPR